MYKASLEIETDDTGAFGSLDLPKYKRSKVIAKKGNGKITFEIESDDAVALVATLGSIVKQLAVVSSVRSIVSDAVHSGTATKH